MVKKYSRYNRTTLVSTTFAQLTFPLGNKTNVYIYQLNWNIDPTDLTELAPDDKLVAIQITSVSQSDQVPLSTHCVYRHTVWVGDIVHGAGAAMTDGHVIPLSGFIEFKSPLLMQNVETFYIGVESLFAGQFSVRLLVKEIDVAL